MMSAEHKPAAMAPHPHAHRHPHPHPNPHRLAQRNTMSRAQARSVLGLVALLVCSGGGWMVVHWLHWPAASLPAMEGLPSPWEPMLMRVHGAAMLLMLWLVGRISGTHAQRGWRLRLRRRGGLWMLACVAALTLSGYLLFYWVPEDWRDGVGLVHGAIGLVWALSLLWHRRPAKPVSNG